jgi:phage shock protein A
MLEPDPEPEIVSLDDRRRIRELEAQRDDLERKLAAALDRANPAITYQRDECYHHGAPKVSDRTPSVTCGDCGAELDPYDVLRKIAHREFNFCYQLNALREEAARLDAEVKRLKASRSRLKRQARSNSNG